ncbi:MAG: ATP-binding protein [Stellaceae bacterium]|jgi:hypothetical protein
MDKFSPFEKPVSELEIGDLTRLREIPEGWYIEYKRQFASVASTAKSISAFANTYGGWLFYGVEGNDNGDRTALSFPGIPLEDLPNLEQWIRQATSTYVSPTPHFELKVLRGPDDRVGLSDNRAIVVIQVPFGNNAPYVHGSGRIYRRIADSSDPTPETDRHFLDLLWQRGRSSRRKFSKFIRREPNVSEAEKNTSYVKLFLFVDLRQERDIRSRLDFKSFSTLMADESAESGGIPFNNIFPSSTGFIARQTLNNNPALQVFTWRYYRDCTSEITIPINSASIDSYSALSIFLDGYDQAESFVALCRARGMNSGWLIDLSQLFSLLICIMKRTWKLLEAENLTWPLFFKAQLSGIWRRVPFIDLRELIQFGEDNGIPIVQDETCFAPTGVEPDSCIKLIDLQNEQIDWEGARMIDACVLIACIGEALGIPQHVLGFDSDAPADTLTRMLNLGTRAIEVTRRRPNQYRA